MVLFTLCSAAAGDAALGACSACPAAYVLHRTALPLRRGRCARRCWCRSCCRPSWSASPSGAARRGRSARRASGSTARRSRSCWPGVLQRGGGDPRRRRRLGVARPAPGQAAAHPRRLAVRRCSAPSRSRRCGPAIASAATRGRSSSARPRSASCSTLGGRRYATIETEICLLTTQLFDLQAAAALSLLQLVVVVVLLSSPAGPRAGPAAPPRRAPRARPGGPPPAARRALAASAVTALVLAFVALPLGALVAGRCGSTAAGASPTTRRSATTGDRRRCWCRSPTRCSTRCAPRSTRPGWRSAPDCSSPWS